MYRIIEEIRSNAREQQIITELKIKNMLDTYYAKPYELESRKK